ncbi:Hypothetical protein ERS075547_03606 [Mycobacteroides abscessus]|nr:Hypothetical protein ERS075547_03606 [Mycobacteroides abscessus]
MGPDMLGDRRSGIRSHGVVTGVKATGAGREMQLDLMVTRPDGGQFPARETAMMLWSAGR